MSDDKKRGPETDRSDKAQDKTPAAGPHARPELTNPDATPGAGSLPDERRSGDSDGGAG